MPIKLNGATSGSIELNVPDAVGSDLQMRLPATAGEIVVKAADGSVDLGDVDIDSSGRLLVGTSSTFGSGSPGDLIHAASGSGGHLLLGRNASSVSTGQTMGLIRGYSYGGGVWQEAGRISIQADAAHGSGDKPGRLVFATTADGASSPTERMRITSTGQLINFSDSSFVFRTVRSGASNALLSCQNNASDIDSGTQVMRILADGDLENANNNYGALSDVKLKENIVDAESQWEDLKAISVRNFNFKEELGFGTNTHIGVVAQELELVSPNLVKTSPDVDADENDLGTTTKSVKYSVLYMKAVKALQEAMERIETLETQNASLEARLTALEGGVN